jgi:hypothetical protein
MDSISKDEVDHYDSFRIDVLILRLLVSRKNPYHHASLAQHFDHQASFMHVIYPHYASNSLSKKYSTYIIPDFQTSPSHLK